MFGDPLKPIELAKNGAADFLKNLDQQLESGAITERTWYERLKILCTESYIASDTPWGQSGKSGDEENWEYSRSLLAEGAIAGTFLDVGCANGYLMECWPRWCKKRGIKSEPYGLEISTSLVALAHSRLPHWKDRIFTGNVMIWPPRMKFDLVRTGLEYVPTRRQKDLVELLFNDYIAPRGRLIIGVYNEERTDRKIERLLASWGYKIAGRAERHHKDPRLAYRCVWINAG